MPVSEFWLVPDTILLKPYADGAIALVATESPGEPERAAKKIDSFLEICALGGVFAPVASAPTSNPLKSPKEMGTNLMMLTIKAIHTYTNEQTKALTPKYVEFLERLKGLYAGYARTLEEAEFIGNAAAYFHRSRSTNEPLNRQFVDAAIALEYLYNESPNDIAYKIAARASVLLSLVGENPVKAFGEIKRLYNVRNDLVHGRLMNPEFADVTKIQHYARSSIKCFCILHSNAPKSKEDRIIELDKLVVDAALRESCAALLNPLVEFDLSGRVEGAGIGRIDW